MSTHGRKATNRHAKYTRTRDTHGQGFSPYADGGAADLYGNGQLPQEPIARGQILPQSVDDGALAFESFRLSHFTESIRPVGIVDTLPTLPDPGYPVGATVVLTTDGKLYRNDADAWTKAVDGVDLVADSVTAGSIAAGAIGVSELAAGAVTVEKLAARGTNLINDGSFENAPAVGFDNYLTASTDLQPYWASATVGSSLIKYGTTSYARTGAHALNIRGNSSNAYPQVNSYLIPVISGVTYHLSAWLVRNAGSYDPRIVVSTYDEDQVLVTAEAAFITHGTSTLTWKEATFTIPVDGSVSFVRVDCVLYAALPTASDIVVIEDVALVPLPKGMQNGPGEVVIDSSGITIYNGKLTLQDEFAASSMNASGFGAEWADFIVNGIYNSRFLGVTGTVPNGRTAALPYWEKLTSSTMPLTALSGGGVKCTYTATGSQIVRSDKVAALSNRYYGVSLDREAAPGIWVSGNIRVSAYVQWWDRSGTIIGSSVLVGYEDIAASGIAGRHTVDYGRVKSPNGTAFMSVQFNVVESGTHYASNELYLYGAKVWVDPTRVGVLLDESDSDLYGTSSAVTTTASKRHRCYVEKGRTYLVMYSCDFEVNTGGVGYMVGELRLDDVAVSGAPQCVFEGQSAGRATVANVWVVAIAGPPDWSNHAELSIYASKTIAAGACELRDHSAIIAIPIG